MQFFYEVIDHVQLATPLYSEEKARVFYVKKLRFEEVEKPSVLKKRGGIWVKAAHVNIHIGIEHPFVPAKKAHPAIRVQHLSVFKQYLLTQGVSYSEDENLPGADRIYVYDPFGNRIEFLEWRSSMVDLNVKL